MSTRSSENDRGEDPAAAGARGDDCADREPCELSERGEPVGPAPELSEAARGDDWALSEASSIGSRLMRTTGGRRRRRVLASSAWCALLSGYRVKRLLLLFIRFDQPLVKPVAQRCGSARASTREKHFEPDA